MNHTIAHISNNPTLMQEWNYPRNNALGLFPDMLSCGSSKRAWWICKNQHEWEAVISSRYSGNGCPYCSGRLPIVGENDLATLFPEVAAEWNYNKNNDLRPEKMAVHSGKTVWWICSKGHEWQAKIEHRVDGVGCPYCSGRYAIPGETDLKTLFPAIAREWNYERNAPLLPSGIKPRSNKKVWWQCSKGHEYLLTVAARTQGSSCPYCSDRSVLVGFNDLETVLPQLAHEWDKAKNAFLPTETTTKCEKKIWWRCKLGHSYQARIRDRMKGNNCPYCSNKAVLFGFNDLETRFPVVAKEWDYAKNGSLSPKDIVFGSNRKVWWKCKKGHEWQTRIAYRTKDGNNCPVCGSAKSVSFPEKALYYYISRYFPSAISNYHGEELLGKEIDIFIPSYRIGVEYDGDYWHQDVARDIEKNNVCSSAGISLIRIREPDCPTLNGYSIDYQMRSHANAEYIKGITFAISTISELTKTNVQLDISLERDYSEISNLIVSNEIDRSLAAVNPELAKEWHPHKNGDLEPTMVAANSGQKVWWLGTCGHEWAAAVASRNSGKCGCPICRGLITLKGYNDLATHFPELTAEWNFEKNGGLAPTMITPNSNKAVWWKCSLGHEYKSKVCDRTRRNYGCPICSSKQLLKGFNDLQTVNPSLAAEWCYEKNGDLTPQQVTPGKALKVWWRCKKCGYEWEAFISNRKKGAGCPNCARRVRKNH